MSRRGVDHEGFAALLPVIDGAEAAVRRTITALPRGTQSPFAALPGTHFARLVLVPRLRDGHARELADVPWCLFFAAEFEMLPGGYLEALCTRMQRVSDDIFGRCVGYPGAGGPPAFKRWMLAHQVRPGFTVIAHPTADAGEVQRSLELRARIIAFAVETQHLDAAALAKRWAQEDWGDAR